MKKVTRQTQASYADVWPPLIDRGDIAWEIAIVLLALVAAILGSARILGGFVFASVVLVAILIMYVWTHSKKN